VIKSTHETDGGVNKVLELLVLPRLRHEGTLLQESARLFLLYL